MTLWIVLGSVLLALFLLSRIRVGGSCDYGKDGLLAKLKVGFLRIQLYPMKLKKKKKKPAGEKVEKPTEEPPAKPGGDLAQLKEFLPLFADAAGSLKRKIRLDKIYLDFIAAASDPAMAAMEYGYANAALGMIWPLFENNFKVEERRIRTAVDFQAPSPTIYVYAALSLTLGQAVTLGIHLLFRFLKITLKIKATQKTEKEAV